MKKHLLLLIALAPYMLCARTARTDWNHNGIYIVNNTEGDLNVERDNGNLLIPKPAKKHTSMALIAVPVGTKLTVTYTDHIESHASMPSCRKGAHVFITTEEKIVLYEITGGYNDGRGAFNRAGIGPHCRIKVHRELNVRNAKKKYRNL